MHRSVDKLNGGGGVTTSHTVPHVFRVLHQECIRCMTGVRHKKRLYKAVKVIAKVIARVWWFYRIGIVSMNPLQTSVSVARRAPCPPYAVVFPLPEFAHVTEASPAYHPVLWRRVCVAMPADRDTLSNRGGARVASPHSITHIILGVS